MYATLIIDDIQHSRKSCHDEYEFKTVPFTIPCCKLHFYHPKLLHIKLQFSKCNKQTPLLPLPEINSIYHAESAGSRDQPRPGSFLKKREEPGNEVGRISPISLGPFSYPEPFLRAARRGTLAKSITGYHENMVIEYIRY